MTTYDAERHLLADHTDGDTTRSLVDEAVRVLHSLAATFAPGEGIVRREIIPGVARARAMRGAGYGKDADGHVWVAWGCLDYAYRGPLRGHWKNPYHIRPELA